MDLLRSAIQKSRTEAQTHVIIDTLLVAKYKYSFYLLVSDGFLGYVTFDLHVKVWLTAMPPETSQMSRKISIAREAIHSLTKKKEHDHPNQPRGGPLRAIPATATGLFGPDSVSMSLPRPALTTLRR